MKLRKLRQGVLLNTSRQVTYDATSVISVNTHKTSMHIDKEGLRFMRENALAGKKRCESDQHASMEYAGTRYSR